MTHTLSRRGRAETSVSARPQRHFMLARGISAVAATLLMLGGCSSHGEDDQRAGETFEVGQLPAQPEPGIRDTFLGLTGDQYVLGLAQEEVVYRCMTELGLEYVKFPPSRERPSFEIRYGVELADAKTVGYETQKRIAPPPPSPLEPLLAAMPESEKKRWYEALGGPRTKGAPQASVRMPDGSDMGAPTQGCDAEARSAVWGSVEAWLQGQGFSIEFRETVISRAEQDPEIRTLNETWAACMKNKGFADLAYPAEAMELAASYYEDDADPKAAFTKEVAVATADAECQQESRYPEKRRLVEDRYLTAAFHKFEGQITAQRELTTASMDRAKKILSG